MKTVTKTLSEYKAPRCKVVDVHVKGNILSASNPGAAGDDLNPVNDDEDY